MTFGPHQDLVLLALLVAIAALLVLAPYLRIPYPILLVLGGLALGFMPGIPTISREKLSSPFLIRLKWRKR